MLSFYNSRRVVLFEHCASTCQITPHSTHSMKKKTMKNKTKNREYLLMSFSRSSALRNSALTTLGPRSSAGAPQSSRHLHRKRETHTKFRWGKLIMANETGGCVNLTN